MIDPLELEERWRTGVSVTRLAQHYRCHYSHIYKLRAKYALQVGQLRNSREPPAPSPEDDAASMSSTRLSPYVQHRLVVLAAAGALRSDNRLMFL